MPSDASLAPPDPDLSTLQPSLACQYHDSSRRELPRRNASCESGVGVWESAECPFGMGIMQREKQVDVGRYCQRLVSSKCRPTVEKHVEFGPTPLQARLHDPRGARSGRCLSKERTLRK